MEGKILYYVVPGESFEAEGRRFYKGESYPVSEKDADYVVLAGENGTFCFNKNLMPKLINEWELTKEPIT